MEGWKSEEGKGEKRGFIWGEGELDVSLSPYQIWWEGREKSESEKWWLNQEELSSYYCFFQPFHQSLNPFAALAPTVFFPFIFST